MGKVIKMRILNEFDSLNADFEAMIAKREQVSRVELLELMAIEAVRVEFLDMVEAMSQGKASRLDVELVLDRLMVLYSSLNVKAIIFSIESSRVYKRIA